MKKKEKKTGKYHKSWGLRKKFVLPTVLLIMTMLGVSAYMSQHMASQSLEKVLNQQLAQAAKSLTYLVEEWLANRQSEIGGWAKQEAYAKATADSFMGKAARKAANETLVELQAEHPIYESLNLADTQGNILASSDLESYTGIDISAAGFFQKAAAGETIVSSPMSSWVTEQPVIAIASPVFEKQEIKGVLFAVIDLKIFCERYINNSQVSDDMYAYLIDANGVIIGHPNFNNVLNLNITDYEFGKQITTKRQGQITYQWKGTKRIATIESFETNDWLAVVAAHHDQIFAPIKQMAWAISLIAVVSVILVGVLVSLLANTVVKSLKKTIDILKDIAEGEGDLTRRIEVKGDDEIGQLGQWFNTFIEKVHNIVSQVATSATEVSSSATEINASSDQMASSMQQQSEQVNEIASAIEEMTASVVEVASQSNNAADNAQQSGQTATEGGNIVNRTIEGMQSINEAVKASSASVSELGKRGEEIGQIIQVINDIADQTNLLALNAAIEAARAGEAGRGFAVVADEVRKLADRTTTATTEIGESIEAIQTETKLAVARMETGTAQVAQGVELATTAGDSLDKIVSSTQQVATMIQSIAAAAEEQSASSEQVSRNVDQITQVSKQAAQGASESARAATDLSTKAEQLQLLVDQFKL